MNKTFMIIFLLTLTGCGKYGELTLKDNSSEDKKFYIHNKTLTIS